APRSTSLEVPPLCGMSTASHNAAPATVRLNIATFLPRIALMSTSPSRVCSVRYPLPELFHPVHYHLNLLLCRGSGRCRLTRLDDADESVAVRHDVERAFSDRVTSYSSPRHGYRIP